MVKVIGVRFRRVGKIYYFDPLDMDIKQSDHVIVETARGVEYGYVVLGIREVAEDKVILPLKPVIRIATPKDDEQELNNKAKEKDAFNICLEKIKKHGLEMKLIDAEYTFDNNKDATEKLKKIIAVDDVALIKASNSMNFKEIVASLLQH